MHQEKLQVWTGKRDDQHEKLRKQETANKTIENRIKVRREELSSKQELVESLRKQITKLHEKCLKQEEDLCHRNEDVEVLKTYLKKLNTKRV